LTSDVDITLLTGFGREEDFISPIVAAGYRERIASAAAFARSSCVLLVNAPNGYPIDIGLGGLPFEGVSSGAVQ
jgi:hypothetical protein